MQKHHKVQDPAIVHAPPKGPHSSFWSPGGIHRDFEGAEKDVFCFFLLLDPIHKEDKDGTVANGSVRFYHGSEELELDPFNLLGSVRKFKYTDLEGEAGKLVIWRGRTVHNSLANASDNGRNTCHWYVTAKTRVVRSD